MNIAEIIKGRNYGYFQIKTCNNYGAPIEKIMESFGLMPKPDWLDECDPDYAVQVLKTLLWKDLAYGHEFVSESVAVERARYLVTQFCDEDTKLFTNGSWADYHKKSSCGFNPVTESTFDGGVLFINNGFAVCIWVEDED